MTQLEDDCLDLLIDDSSSVAALYASLIRAVGYNKGVNLTDLMNALVTLKERGHIQIARIDMETNAVRLASSAECQAFIPEYENWLSMATFEDMAVDEIGVWAEITDEGYKSARAPGDPLTKPERIPLL